LRGCCLAWYDASLGRWRSSVQIRPTPLNPRFKFLRKKVNIIPETGLQTPYVKISTEFDNSILNKDSKYTLRDFYNRKAKLEYWIDRVNKDLQGTDRLDLLKIIEYMQDKERASLWIIRCIAALISISSNFPSHFEMPQEKT
jgi:hypothetical protein